MLNLRDIQIFYQFDAKYMQFSTYAIVLWLRVLELKHLDRSVFVLVLRVYWSMVLLTSLPWSHTPRVGTGPVKVPITQRDHLTPYTFLRYMTLPHAPGSRICCWS